MGKFTHFISWEEKNNKGYVKYVFWKVFKNSIKLLTSSFPVILQTFFIQKSHSKGNLALNGLFKGISRALWGHWKGNQKALGHSYTIWVLGYSKGTRRALEYLRQPFTQRALGHSGTRTHMSIGQFGTQHLSTRALKRHLWIQGLRHLGTRGTLFSKLLLEEKFIANILKVKIVLDEQINLKSEFGNFKESRKPEDPDKKVEKHWLLNSQLNFLKEEKIA